MPDHGLVCRKNARKETPKQNQRFKFVEYLLYSSQAEIF